MFSLDQNIFVQNVLKSYIANLMFLYDSYLHQEAYIATKYHNTFFRFGNN